MKKKILTYANIGVLVVVATMTLGSFALGSNPGGASDPVVTQSYVEARLQSLNDSLQTQINNIDTSAGPGLAMQAFEIIAVEAGQTIVLEEHTQFILRSGQATAIAGSGGGLSDLTAGVDLTTNDPIEKNHLLLIPRSDGRGVYFKSQAYIMVNGKYVLE